MSEVTVRFACGHTQAVDPGTADRPICAICGETRIAIVNAPPPQFRGVATGPHCQ